MSEERMRCYTTGDEIKFLHELVESDKPEFREITDAQLMYLFKDMIVTKEDDEPQPIELDSSLSFSIYDEEWYRMKFSGFPEDIYGILAEVDKKQNEEPVEKMELID